MTSDFAPEVDKFPKVGQNLRIAQNSVRAYCLAPFPRRSDWTHLQWAADECILCREGWRRGSSQITSRRNVIDLACQ